MSVTNSLKNKAIRRKERLDRKGKKTETDVMRKYYTVEVTTSKAGIPYSRLVELKTGQKKRKRGSFPVHPLLTKLFGL